MLPARLQLAELRSRPGWLSQAKILQPFSCSQALLPVIVLLRSTAIGRRRSRLRRKPLRLWTRWTWRQNSIRKVLGQRNFSHRHLSFAPACPQASAHLVPHLAESLAPPAHRWHRPGSPYFAGRLVFRPRFLLSRL